MHVAATRRAVAAVSRNRSIKPGGDGSTLIAPTTITVSKRRPAKRSVSMTTPIEVRIGPPASDRNVTS